MKITKGWDRDEMRQLVKETLNEAIEPLIYAEALELIDFHLARGEEVYLVSSAPAEIVEPFAELLGMTGAISSHATIDEDGKFTGEMEFFALGENKASRARTGPEAGASTSTTPTAYSDSESDIPMLETVGHRLRRQPPIACSPKFGPRAPVADTRLPPPGDAPSSRTTSHAPFLVSAPSIGVAALLGRLGHRRR